MKNLESFGVQELNARECFNVNGGITDNILTRAGYAIGSLFGAVAASALIGAKMVMEKLL